MHIRETRHVVLTLAVVAIVAAPLPITGSDGQTATTQKSLYDRLGGKEAITAVVNDFVARVGKDERINKKFARSDGERVRLMLIDQVCEATGGPCKYTGRSMKDAHRRMAVTTGEFDALVEDLVASLNHFKVPKTEQDELLAALGPMKKDIVETESSATGTPLPSDFKPAPPVKKRM